MQCNASFIKTLYILSNLQLFGDFQNECKRITTHLHIDLRKNGISETKTLEMLSNAFVYNTISRTIVLEWHRRFKVGRNSTEDDTRIGRPKTSVSGDNVEIMKEMVMSNHQITVEELAEEIFISRGSCHTILCNHFWSDYLNK